MNLRTVIQWLLVIGVVSWIVTNPSSAANIVGTVFGGGVTFFQESIGGITSAFH